MARLANDAGLFRVIIDSPTKRGYPIRLGRVSPRLARDFRSRVTELEDAVRLSAPPRAALVEWLEGLAADVHEKLVRAGLALPRIDTGLKQWLEKHLASKTTMREASKTKLRLTHEKLLGFFAPDLNIAKLTPNEAHDWHTWLSNQSLSRATIRTHCGNVKSIFNAAVKRCLIRINPFTDLASGSTPSKDAAFVAEQDALAVIEKLPDTAFKLLLGLARLAGLRTPSETRPLRTSDVDLVAGMIHVQCVKTEEHQHRHERFVPICPKLRALLVARLAEIESGAELCPIGSSDGIGGHARRTIEAAVAAAGVAKWPDMFQTLRSSLAKDWKARGIPEFAVDAWLGHNNVTSRKHYTSTVPPQMFELISGVKQAAQNPAQKTLEVGGSKGTAAEVQKEEAAENPRVSEDFQQLPVASVEAKMEAGGIEPAATSPDSLAKSTIPQSGGAKSGALPSDPQFNEVLTAWPSLSAASRADVVHLVRRQVESRAEDGGGIPRRWEATAVRPVLRLDGGVGEVAGPHRRDPGGAAAVRSGRSRINRKKVSNDGE